MKPATNFRSRAFILLAILIATTSFTFCTKKRSTSSATTIADSLQYKLVWSDEFNGTSIDTSVWNFDTGNNGWGNNELENYQPSNASIANGNLVITAKKEVAGSANYTSSRMKTEGNKSFTYGRIEARIKMPAGQGLWPAFWMLGANISGVGWPQCGEIDIMEHINADSLFYGTAHWNNNGHVSSGGKTVATTAGYHVYDVEWTASAITWHLDGVAYWKTDIAANANGTAGFHLPFFIILNLAVGGNWPGLSIDNTKFPASMYIDYVRVYQLQ